MPDKKRCRKFLYIGDNGTFATITECMPEEYIHRYKIYLAKLFERFMTPDNDFGQFQVVIIEHKHGVEALEAEKGYFVNSYHTDDIAADINFTLEP